MNCGGNRCLLWYLCLIPPDRYPCTSELLKERPGALEIVAAITEKGIPRVGHATELRIVASCSLALAPTTKDENGGAQRFGNIREGFG
jgi:hypothetical protein